MTSWIRIGNAILLIPPSEGRKFTCDYTNATTLSRILRCKRRILDLHSGGISERVHSDETEDEEESDQHSGDDCVPEPPNRVISNTDSTPRSSSRARMASTP